MRRMFEFGVFTSVVTRKRVSLVLRMSTFIFLREIIFHFPSFLYIYISVFQSELLVVTQLVRASTVVVSCKNEIRLIIINITHFLLSIGTKVSRIRRELSTDERQ